MPSSPPDRVCIAKRALFLKSGLNFSLSVKTPSWASGSEKATLIAFWLLSSPRGQEGGEAGRKSGKPRRVRKRKQRMPAAQAVTLEQESSRVTLEEQKGQKEPVPGEGRSRGRTPTPAALHSQGWHHKGPGEPESVLTSAVLAKRRPISQQSPMQADQIL